MTRKAFTLAREVTQIECHWLDHDLKQGTVVHEYIGVTYGCIGPNGIAVTLEDGVEPFFEVPRDALASAAS